MEESINTASWLKFISNLQRLGAILRNKKQLTTIENAVCYLQHYVNDI